VITTWVGAIKHTHARRKLLRKQFDIQASLTEIEETCVPSYTHRNWLAAAVAWARLYAAARLFRRLAPAGPILDFGAATGELGHLVAALAQYEFVEADELMARTLLQGQPNARRRSLTELPSRYYATIFALDSLEHNDDVSSIIARLCAALRSDGVLILSGPTENVLYRLGRRIAGFRGGYHKTTIYEIENIVRQRMTSVSRKLVPQGLPLFSVSCWRLADAEASRER
jgi:2-polyprenyl-3-methyl-5-hydroxy-6-metoxy-1,4-benzoquinol methylase